MPFFKTSFVRGPASALTLKPGHSPPTLRHSAVTKFQIAHALRLGTCGQPQANEKAMQEKRVTEVERFLDREKKHVFYKLSGQPLDSSETLERDGLIKTERNKRGKWVSTLLLAPDNIRVILWVRSLNETCRLQGVPEMFEGFEKEHGMQVIDAQPSGSAVQ
jgi:hypothetical protein